jgi:hypothetical protein
MSPFEFYLAPPSGGRVSRLSTVGPAESLLRMPSIQYRPHEESATHEHAAGLVALGDAT